MVRTMVKYLSERVASPGDLAQLATEGAHGIDNVTAPQFKWDNRYTTFEAEYHICEYTGDVTIHFFPSSEDNLYMKVWVHEFGPMLETCVLREWHPDPSRFRAAWTEELSSWWLRAYGFGRGLGVEALRERFFDALDAAMDLRLAPPAKRG
jgi:hypothetical protein